MKERKNPHGCSQRSPLWLKKKTVLKSLHKTKSGLRNARLSTVCEEARCPNITECFNEPSATFLILGDVCTRSCRFCAVRKGNPSPPDPEESLSVARAAVSLGLEHAVITSVSRDDLEDKGAGAFASAIREVRKSLPHTSIEVLVPDFSGRRHLIETVLSEKPDVFNHNVETVGRLYRSIRPQAKLETSLKVLRTAREYSEDFVVKSGFMVGLGETEDEILDLMCSLKHAGCDIVTIGQYLQPTLSQVPVAEYRRPEDFKRFSDLAKSVGIRYAISGPLVRSSYQARDIFERVRLDRDSERIRGRREK
ncbi:MAG TPA: lipoyl synthase [Deltaproteobacteria bacterium]|nr:lipoyl synthase [Deltaproteobacteria bacterium]HQI01792.1 lipoyl synthase [Deltaproteobacteria bacterium]